MTYDKDELVKHLVTEIESSLANLCRSWETARQSAIEAEGRMVSRYDTAKEEQGKLADAFAREIAELREMLHIIKGFERRASKDGSICVGSLVAIAADGREETYFIIPGGAGHTVKIDDAEITMISPGAPLAQSLIGRKAGERPSAAFGPERERTTIGWVV